MSSFCYCSAALPHGAISWAAVCDCGVSKSYSLAFLLYGPQREKTCLRRFANNTGTDQPVHLLSLINAFVIRLLESI